MLTLQNSVTYTSVIQTGPRTDLLAWRLPIIALLLTSTRLICLNRQSLWFDEGYTLSLAKTRNLHDFFHIFGTFTTSEHLQPLYYLLIFLWSRIGGTADVALRLPSIIFSITSGLIVYTFAANLSSRQAASSSFPLLVVTCYASSSFAFYYAQEARPYALVQMLSFLVLTLWYRDRHSGQSRSIAFTTACLLSVIASPFALLLVLSLSLTDLLLDQKRWFKRWRWPISLIGTTLISYLLLGWVLLPSCIAADVVSLRQPLWMNAGYLLYGIFFGTTLGPPNSVLRSVDKIHALVRYWPIFVVCGTSFLALSRGVYLSLRIRIRSESLSRDLALATAVYAALLFLIFGFAGHLNLLPRHASALFAMIFILCTSCAFPRTRHLQWEHIYFTSGLIGVLALNLLSMWNYWNNPSFRKDDYRAAANMLRQDELQRTGLAYLIAGDASLFQHYRVSLIDLSEIKPSELTESLRRVSHDAPEVRLVINQHRNFRWDHSADPTVVLQPTYRCSIQESFASMEVVGCHLNLSDGYYVVAVMDATIPRGAYAR